MKVVGFITEYNPFHYGHKYHLEESKKITKAEYSIAVMSGSFVQRGEPSFIDKWTKAKIAIDNGVDLVLELPIIFSTQSAERFAFGGVKLLDSLNIVDYITFGSELGNIEPLNKISKILSEEPQYYNNQLLHYLEEGNSYSVARSHALKDYFIKEKTSFHSSIERIIESPNNILGIEYLKALYKINSSIQPITFQRIGSEYKDEKLSSNKSSSTAIRNNIFKKDLPSVRNNVPAETYAYLEQFLKEHNSFNSLENYSQILLYLLCMTSPHQISKVIDVEEGLENRIINMAFKYNSSNNIIDNTVSKRHTKTRIQRILIHMLLNLQKQDFYYLKDNYPEYYRVLGANEKGVYLLRKIKENSNIPIINKFSDFKKIRKPSFRKMINYDKKGTDLFYLGLNSNPWANKDFYTSPYIKV
ncbi:MAG TPA: nucleotidyltransferase [Tissierellales bacterium]|nr:nucleotidyltransferase [Tissierellales bacterium]